MQTRTAAQQGAPHPMGQTPKAAAAKAAAGAKAAKAAKAAAKVPTHLTKGGQPAECQVMLNGSQQCANPSRHEWIGPMGGLPKGQHGWSCTTHGKRISQGAQRVWTKVDKAYDPTLWGGTLAAPKAAPKAASQPKAAKAAPRAKAAPKAASQPEAAPKP